jgi:hypothetical protein
LMVNVLKLNESITAAGILLFKVMFFHLSIVTQQSSIHGLQSF